MKLPLDLERSARARRERVGGDAFVVVRIECRSDQIAAITTSSDGREHQADDLECSIGVSPRNAGQITFPPEEDKLFSITQSLAAPPKITSYLFFRALEAKNFAGIRCAYSSPESNVAMPRNDKNPDTSVTVVSTIVDDCAGSGRARVSAIGITAPAMLAMTIDKTMAIQITSARPVLRLQSSDPEPPSSARSRGR